MKQIYSVLNLSNIVRKSVRLFLIFTSLLFCISTYAQQIVLEIPKDQIFGVQPPNSIWTKYRISEKLPFPLDNYVVRATVHNPLFEHRDESDKINLRNSENFEINAELKLISYSRLFNTYRFNFKLDQKITMEKFRNLHGPIRKELSGSTLFNISKSNEVLLKGKFLKINESKPIQSPTEDYLEIFRDPTDSIYMQTARSFQIILNLQDVAE